MTHFYCNLLLLCKVKLSIYGCVILYITARQTVDIKTDGQTDRYIYIIYIYIYSAQRK